MKPPAFTLVFCSAYSTLKMEAICSFETLVDFQQTITRRYISEDIISLSNINHLVFVVET
jgi:hypothetical protein